MANINKMIHFDIRIFPTMTEYDSLLKSQLDVVTVGFPPSPSEDAEDRKHYIDVFGLYSDFYMRLGHNHGNAYVKLMKHDYIMNDEERKAAQKIRTDRRYSNKTFSKKIKDHFNCPEDKALLLMFDLRSLNATKQTKLDAKSHIRDERRRRKIHIL